MSETNNHGFNPEEGTDEGRWDDSRSFAVQNDHLPDGRSFESEMWGEDGYTFLTYRFPAEGLENSSKSQVADYLISQGINIDLEEYPAENMQLLPNFENHDLLELTITIAAGDE